MTMLDIFEPVLAPIPETRTIRCAACIGTGKTMTGETCPGCGGRASWTEPFLGGGCVGGCGVNRHWHQAHLAYTAVHQNGGEDRG